MWLIYGSISDGSYYDPTTGQPDDPWDSGPGSVFSYGSEPTYQDWMALKYCWSRSTLDKQNFLRNVLLVRWPQSADGYLWSWSTQEKWPEATSSGRWHQDNNAKYILASWRYWAWTRDDAFLTALDPDFVTSPSATSRPDLSQGKTVQQKLRLAMHYMELELQGNLGGIPIEDNGVNTDGTTSGDPTNYWDNWRMGYKNAYTSAYYYAALEAMAQLEEFWGDGGRAAQLRAWRAGCKTDYDTTFWNAAKGRFYNWIDKNGVPHDFGMTFVNLEALSYGLGDAGKAASIFDWLDGARTVAGDTSTGADIYHYGFAPRSNTLAAESSGAPYYWDDAGGLISVADPGEADWNSHLENGGAIFYVSYFDLMARLQYLGADGALARLNGILSEFQTDQLRRDPYPSAGPRWVLGLIGEFPESGLPSTFMLHGFGGLAPDAAGLNIKPQIPSAWTHMNLNGVTFAGTALDLHITPTQITVSSAATSARTLYVNEDPVAPGASMVFGYTPGDGILLSLTIVTPVELSALTLD
jgi:hypothetical protein